MTSSPRLAIDRAVRLAEGDARPTLQTATTRPAIADDKAPAAQPSAPALKAAGPAFVSRLPPALRRLLGAPPQKKPGTIADYLKTIGHTRSALEKRPVDQGGKPLPWYTYGAISFIEGRTRPEFHVFEYGCGNSTLWWAKRSASVTSCEHSPGWVQRMRKSAPSNVTLIQRDIDYDGEYCRSILTQDRMFDVVVNDGRDRVGCARQLVERLAPHGVVVWDNSDRDRYGDGYDFLHERGFRRIDFTGLGPVNWRGWMTSVFYRDGNCFGI